MAQPRRLASGGRIDRERPLEFTFNGRRLVGYAGDTLASALLANDVTLVARSFKYHRPRGVIGAGSEEPNALVQVGTGARTLPNCRTTQVELYDGLQCRSVNCWPSVDFDVSAVTGAFSRLLPAGFYYKTFMWPAGLWMTYERYIRRAAGLGEAPREPDPDYYDAVNEHCDVLVAGAGPAGLGAALAAARAGARVLVADESSQPGGSLLATDTLLDQRPAVDWVRDAVEELQRHPAVRVLPRTTVFGYYDHNFLGLVERVSDHLAPGTVDVPRQRLWRVRARQVVLAAGAIERPLVFGNNDRPGIMTASAVSTYVNRYAVAPGRRAVVFTNNDSAYLAALDLAAAGVEVACVIDAREDPQGALPMRARQGGMDILAGHVVVNAAGGSRVTAAEVMALDAGGEHVRGQPRRIECDLLVVSGGWSPAVHLHAQGRGRPRYDAQRACFVPGESLHAERSAGSCNGTFALGDCLAEGMAAGRAAAAEAGFGEGDAPRVPAVDEFADEPLRPLWLVPSPRPPGHGPKQFVDYQNDTSAADILLAAREGYHSIEHVKRYTALGFGTDQGKLGNINGMAILARALGQDIAATGTTTFRPAYTPVTFGAIAGHDVNELFDPVRVTAMHAWHEEHGAEFENVGQWKRPWYYPHSGERLDDAVARECLATRNSLGILDASTLGKIDIRGPDARELLNRVYTNAWNKLEPGRCRYGLMLGEDGMVMDDGVSSCIADDHFLMTTTTGGAAHVLAWLEQWLQTEWPDLRVYLTSVTDHWAVASIAGPNSRRLIEELCSDIDFSREAFPFMSWREGTVAGIPARVFRISFSGELSYEINVSANHGRALWEALMEAGTRYDITPYGTETMHVLRAEKGYIIVGQDTDGSVTPVDLGMGGLVSKTKDFLGKRSLNREDCVREDRKQLVGLLTDNPRDVLPEGAQLVDDPDAPKPVPMLGHVTSSYFSACLGHSIALAVVKGGRARQGDHVFAPLAEGSVIRARICDPVFYDPGGERQNV